MRASFDLRDILPVSQLGKFDIELAKVVWPENKDRYSVVSATSRIVSVPGNMLKANVG